MTTKAVAQAEPTTLAITTVESVIKAEASEFPLMLAAARDHRDF